MKQLEVQIMGQSYLLGCPEGGESQLLHAVEKVDAAMCKIRDAGKVRARERIAVLAALNLAFDLASPSTDSVPNTHFSDYNQAPAGSENPEVLLTSLLDRLDAALNKDGHPL